MSDEKEDSAEETFAERVAPASSLANRMKEWTVKDAGGNFIKKWSEAEPVDVETEKFDPHHEFDEVLRSGSDLERLRALSTKLARQLAEAKKDDPNDYEATFQALVASKAVVDELQLQNIRLHQTLRYLRRWVLSREVTDLVLSNEKLREEKAELSRQIMSMIVEKNLIKP